MKSSSNNTSSQQILNPLLRDLWQQWNALGANGHYEGDLPTMIDPEALILCSSEFARHDARLFEVYQNWLLKNGSLINLQRLVNIRKSYHLGNDDVMRSLAHKLSNSSSRLSKWKKIATHSVFNHVSHEEPRQQRENLLYSIPLETQLSPDMLDEDFMNYGLVALKFENRDTSTPPSQNKSCNLIFKLRALFGCNSRAEILAWLITTSSGHPARIAHETHYFTKSVQETLNQLAKSELISFYRGERLKHFSLDQQHWLKFLNTASPQRRDWARLFACHQLFHSKLEKKEKSKASNTLISATIKSAHKNSKFTHPLIPIKCDESENYSEYIIESLMNTLQTP